MVVGLELGVATYSTFHAHSLSFGLLGRGGLAIAVALIWFAHPGILEAMAKALRAGHATRREGLA